MKINSVNEDIIKSILDSNLLSNLIKYTLCRNDERGFMFQGNTSDVLSLLGIEHDEEPHLFREIFKKNRNDSQEQNKGVDFRIIVNGYKVMIECKDWKYAYECWLHNVTDRFQGKENNGDFNLCVVANKHSSGFFKLRHILKQQGIILLADYELSDFLYKLMERAINTINRLSFIIGKLSFVYRRFTTTLKKSKKYLLYFRNSTSFIILRENSMKNIHKVLPRQCFLGYLNSNLYIKIPTNIGSNSIQKKEGKQHESR